MLGSKVLVRLLVAGIALVGLLIVLDVVALQVYESRGAAQAARAMAAERASLDLGGFPFLPGYLRGQLDGVELEVTGSSGGGLRIAKAEATFAELRFDTSEAFALVRNLYATRTVLRGSDVFGRIEINQDDLGRFIRAREPSVTDVRITSSGIELVFRDPDAERPPEEPVPVARFLPRVEEVDVEGRRERRLRLVLVGRSGLSRPAVEAAERLTGAIDLPSVPAGLQTDVSLFNGFFTVEASGPQVQLRVGEGEVPSRG